jgi:thiol-disulfide isomerase/thioredoxin
MGKASRVKQQSARERIAAQRAAERRREQRNRLYWSGGAIALVVVVVVAFLFVKSLNKGSSTSAAAGGAAGGALSASVTKDLSAVPAATLDSVQAGAAYPKSITPVSAPALTSGGKPEVLYIGAEYCPYCAAERWAMVVALSRFGTFSGLRGIHSSSTDVYANTPTVTFYKARYTSRYLTFSTVEEQTVTKATLQRPTSAQQALISKYDAPPYVQQADAGAIPFIDFGGKYLVHGSQYNPQLLAGKTWSQVAAALRDPSSSIAKGVDGAANTATAAICKITNNQPSSVCSSATIQKLEGQL